MTLNKNIMDWTDTREGLKKTHFELSTFKEANKDKILKHEQFQASKERIGGRLEEVRAMWKKQQQEIEDCQVMIASTQDDVRAKDEEIKAMSK